MSTPELKVKITELEKALNLTGSHLKELRTELKMQKEATANLTTQVKDINFNSDRVDSTRKEPIAIVSSNLSTRKKGELLGIPFAFVLESNFFGI